jgi:hypothetical protein
LLGPKRATIKRATKQQSNQKATKQQSNEATKQQINEATKQRSNEATKQRSNEVNINNIDENLLQKLILQQKLIIPLL